MSKKAKMHTVELHAPPNNSRVRRVKSNDELDSTVSEITDLGHKLLILTQKRDARIAKAKESYKKPLSILTKRITVLMEAAMRYSNKNRLELLPKDRKSVSLTRLEDATSFSQT